jgi:hypothetical protein
MEKHQAYRNSKEFKEVRKTGKTLATFRAWAVDGAPRLVRLDRGRLERPRRLQHLAENALHLVSGKGGKRLRPNITQRTGT